MGITLTVLVIGALLVAARAALKGFQEEIRKSSNLVQPDPILDPVFLPAEDGPSRANSEGHSVHHGDTGCNVAHHTECDIGGHGSFDGGHGGFGGHH
jgi:hypothetical protein